MVRGVFHSGEVNAALIVRHDLILARFERHTDVCRKICRLFRCFDFVRSGSARAADPKRRHGLSVGLYVDFGCPNDVFNHGQVSVNHMLLKVRHSDGL